MLLRERKWATGQVSDSAKVLNITTHYLNGCSGNLVKGANHGIIKTRCLEEGTYLNRRKRLGSAIEVNSEA